MGQPIEITSSAVVDRTAIFATDRGITGQDGSSFEPGSLSGEEGSFPERLAARVFEAASGVDHVFVASNQVVVGRDGGWDDEALSAVTVVIERFFVHYPGAAA